MALIIGKIIKKNDFYNGGEQFFRLRARKNKYFPSFYKKYTRGKKKAVNFVAM